MTKLYDLGNDKYKLVTDKYGSREGTLRHIVEFAVFDLFISYKEIESALVSMNTLDHNVADFGIHGTFIFSFVNKELKHAG